MSDEQPEQDLRAAPASARQQGGGLVRVGDRQHPVGEPFLEHPLDEGRSDDEPEVAERASRRRDGHGPAHRHPPLVEIANPMNEDALALRVVPGADTHLDQPAAEGSGAVPRRGRAVGENGIGTGDKDGREHALVLGRRHSSVPVDARPQRDEVTPGEEPVDLAVAEPGAMRLRAGDDTELGSKEGVEHQRGCA